MMAKLYNALAVIAIATMLSSGGLVGFLFGTGKLNPARVEKIGAVLRGELDEAAATQPAAGSATESEMGSATSESTATGTTRPASDGLRSLALDRAKRDLEARQRLLDQTLAHVLSEQEQLKDQQKSWTEKRAKLRRSDQGAGLEREVEFISGLPPTQAKEHLIRLWKKQSADAVQVLMRLDVGKGKRILAAMKTPEETEIMSQLLEQLRAQDIDGYTPASGRTDGPAAP